MTLMVFLDIEWCILVCFCSTVFVFVFVSWWRHQMETFSALLALCAGNSPVPGEFPAQRPVTRSFDVIFDLRPNKRLSIQSWGRWFETLSCSLWRHCNGVMASCVVFCDMCWRNVWINVTKPQPSSVVCCDYHLINTDCYCWKINHVLTVIMGMEYGSFRPNEQYRMYYVCGAHVDILQNMAYNANLILTQRNLHTYSIMCNVLAGHI